MAGRRKLSPWISGDVKPVLVGVYERQMFPGVTVYALWDGTRWSAGDISPPAAMLFKRTRSDYQNRPWRGLAQKP